MRAIRTIPLVLVTFCALAIGVSLLIGHLQPSSERIASLHLADCNLPCWNGITPGVSAGSEVIDQVSSTFPSLSTGSVSYPYLSWQSSSWATGYTNISVGFDDQHSVAVVSISSTYASTVMPSFGDMLMAFGSPTCVAVNENSGAATAGYENETHQLVLQFTTNQPSLASPVKSMLFGFSKTFTCQKAAMSWHDFRKSQFSLAWTS